MEMITLLGGFNKINCLADGSVDVHENSKDSSSKIYQLSWDLVLFYPDYERVRAK